MFLSKIQNTPGAQIAANLPAGVSEGYRGSRSEHRISMKRGLNEGVQGKTLRFGLMLHPFAQRTTYEFAVRVDVNLLVLGESG